MNKGKSTNPQARVKSKVVKRKTKDQKENRDNRGKRKKEGDERRKIKLINQRKKTERKTSETKT